jgi:hypothetical protein
MGFQDGHKRRGVTRIDMDGIEYTMLTGSYPISQINDDPSIRDSTCTTAAVANAMDSVLDLNLFWKIAGFFTGANQSSSFDKVQGIVADMIRTGAGKEIFQGIVNAKLAAPNEKWYLFPQTSLVMMRILGAPIRFAQCNGVKLKHVYNLIQKGYAVIAIVNYTITGTRHAVCINGVGINKRTQAIDSLHFVDSMFNVRDLVRDRQTDRIMRTSIIESSGWVRWPVCDEVICDEQNNPFGLANAPCWIVGHWREADEFNVNADVVKQRVDVDVKWELLKESFRYRLRAAVIDDIENIDTILQTEIV